ncbi:MAG: DUF1501 domain-containing protein, partial [Methylococcales bacterium]|nr:DUF1501 domain-containing protein [Methylococcales bacterium]
MPKMTRRQFMVDCSTAVAAMAGARFNSVVFGNPEDEPNQEILLVVFLRGGMDVLNLLPPLGAPDRAFYEAARSNLKVPVADILQFGTSNFGFHPSAAGLHDLYTNNSLAVIQATGMHEDTRSHFDAMNYMELGTPGLSAGTNGWITRHLQTSPNLPPEIVFPALSASNYSPMSFLGSTEVVSMSDPSNFALNTGPWLWQWAQRSAMRSMYEAGTSSVHSSGVQTLNAADIIELNVSETYTPPAGVVYPDDAEGFGDHLKVVAQMIKLQLGLQVATIDLGGWDTHESQGDGSGGYFADHVGVLSSGLSALYADLEASGSYNSRLTIAVMSEFGRRVDENGDDGTDHGHGSAMMVLGGNVNGGLYGNWPGLDPSNELYEGIDLDVTTDYRRVLSEILIRRLGNPK